MTTLHAFHEIFTTTNKPPTLTQKDSLCENPVFHFGAFDAPLPQGNFELIENGLKLTRFIDGPLNYWFYYFSISNGNTLYLHKRDGGVINLCKITL